MKLVPEPRGKVVLVYPPLEPIQFPLWAPLESYAIATALMHAGYEVELIDMRVDTDARERLALHLPDALLVGISTMIGNQLRTTLGALAHVKALRPDVPILVGGWFPSLFPASLFESPHVDLVAIGPGDASTPEVADRLLEGRSMEGLQGIWAREEGRIVRNDFAHLPDIEETHSLPYEELGVARYIQPDGWLSAFTSRGCPGECTFCSVYCLDPRRWTAFRPERVVDDFERMAALGARAFKVMDTDFFADVRRVEGICRLVLERGLDIRFEVLGRHWNLRTMSDEGVRLLRRAGCTEIEMGVESGSQRVVDRLRKKLDLREVPDLVRRFTRAGIRMKLNFMFGIPTETLSELRATVRMICGLVDELGSDAVRLQLFRYTPMPGSPATDEVDLQRPGQESSLSLVELAEYPVSEDYPGRMTWIPRDCERAVKAVYYFYAPLAFFPSELDPARGHDAWRLVLRLLRPLARWRLRHGFLRLPIEAWLHRRLGYPLRHGSDIIGPFEDVLPPTRMGNTYGRSAPLEPQPAEA